ncbi:hypothetical protein BC826DRAFT_658826 [Russula brevipes]|nr:hypothetical protein BC826DRAFT_658826 [Russula brevipes]
MSTTMLACAVGPRRRMGDRWHLQGSNGSGKTTLLSTLTGDLAGGHPQSYTQRAPTSTLKVFSAPCRTHATTQLRSRIGVVSPGLYNALPRGRKCACGRQSLPASTVASSCEYSNRWPPSLSHGVLRVVRHPVIHSSSPFPGTTHDISDFRKLT